MIGEFTKLRPAGGFKVILADPPWSYKNWSNNGEEKNPNAHYDTMDMDPIAAMPVESLAAQDAALFIWATWPHMPSWNRVIEAWGFEFKGLAWEWIKFNPVTGKYAFGLGYGTRKNLEPCLLATRGNPKMRKEFGARSVRDFIEESPGDCIRSPRREHSRKPDEQYSRIETMFDGPYIELFARQKRPGWSAFGNETDKYKEPAQ
jgi:N6-adenosine-specific RNA methylase IME4